MVRDAAHPLLSHTRLDAVLAWTANGPRTVRQFIVDAHELAASLPPAGHLLNICKDRYRFAVGFAAGLLDARVSLQPTTLLADTLPRLRADYPDVVCLTDDNTDTRDLPQYDFPTLPDARAGERVDMPMIRAEQVAAILFTSGSTGLPQPHPRSWGSLVRGAQAQSARLGLRGQAHTIVGTVPVQHSYGFESTLLLPMQSQGSFWSGQPFYPQDFAIALIAVPAPRMLVTTPHHLAVLLASDVALPPVARFLLATAPLSDALARRAEQRFGAPVHEIYGSTESGHVASRRTTDGPEWRPLDGVMLDAKGDDVWFHGGHIERRVASADLLQLSGGGQFILRGRKADLVNIAGKRTSLDYLNHQVCAIAGVRDAAFFLPEDTGTSDLAVTRLALFVVAPELSVSTLVGELRQRIDPVFMPNPIVALTELPRNAMGKLPRSSLQALHAEYRSGVGADERR